jgi:transcriptional regulator GlxA family with amidase domain
MRIEFVLFDGFDEVDVFGPFEVLATAGFEVELVAPDRPGTVVSMRGIRLDIPTALGTPEGLIVPGGGWLDRAPEGAWAQARRGELPKKLAEVARTARWLGSVCTGAMLLAEAGLLNGRYATTNRGAFTELEPYVAEVIEERVVDDGDRITAAGLTAGIDLGLWITERESGTAKADEVAHTIEYTRQGRVWRAPRHSNPEQPPR